MSRLDPSALIDALLLPLAAPCAPVQRDRNRTAVLEFLFEADGREDPTHPHAFTYTGLARQYQAAFGRWLLEQLTESWHLDDDDECCVVAGEPCEPELAQPVSSHAS